VILLTIKYSRK